ncbi:MAG TPA: DUF3619 family protein [Burkholderiaceae bacterium]|nr:DUF3619 family protein [Burkholderiaceae bacterium]
MNSLTMPSSRAMTGPAVAADTLQTRFALRVAARLSERSEELEPELGERLRVAREQALERARALRKAEMAPARLGTSGGAAILGSGPRWWWKLVGGVLPALALIGGLILIQKLENEAQISTAAEIDAALLTDDLPPAAYNDAGFAEYLKTPRE